MGRNVKSVKIRRNVAPNEYHFNLYVGGVMMQEYDTQTGEFSPNVTAAEKRTLLTGTLEKSSVDGTTGVESVRLGALDFLYRTGETGEWKNINKINVFYGFYNLMNIYLRQQANIQPGVTYEIKLVATVADPDTGGNVKVESDVFRFGCNDKTKDEIRLKLVEGVTNIVYNPEAPAPYTPAGLERATFLQQCVFEVTRGGKRLDSSEVTVTAEEVGPGGTLAREGVDLMYDFSRWTQLYIHNTIPDAKTDQIGNSVHMIDNFVGLHADTWTINKGGLFTYAAGARKMDILWWGKISGIRLLISAGTSGTTPNPSWVTLDKASEGKAHIECHSTGEQLDAYVYIDNMGDSITEKGVTLVLAGNLVIESMEIRGMDAESVMKHSGSYCHSKGYGGGMVAADVCTRHALQKLEVSGGTVTAVMDCGSGESGAVALRVRRKDGSVLYDERVIAFRRKFPDLEMQVAMSPFVESKTGKTQQMRVNLIAEGHPVTEPRFYNVLMNGRNMTYGSLQSNKCFYADVPDAAEVELKAVMRGTLEII